MQALALLAPLHSPTLPIWPRHSTPATRRQLQSARSTATLLRQAGRSTQPSHPGWQCSAASVRLARAPSRTWSAATQRPLLSANRATLQAVRGWRREGTHAHRWMGLGSSHRHAGAAGGWNAPRFWQGQHGFIHCPSTHQTSEPSTHSLLSGANAQCRQSRSKAVDFLGCCLGGGGVERG